MKTNIRYSEAFKRQVVEELGSGLFETIEQARRAYGIRGCETVRRWVAKYGRDQLRPKRIRIETMKEANELREARKRIRELEAALADAHIDQCLEESYLEIACERLGSDPDAFKKKHDLTLSDVRRKKGRK